MATAASWYHCSLKPVSRSAGRSVVAAAAYRLGECLLDERYAVTHDYTRRRGVEATFTVAPVDAPEWARDAQALWNAAELAETRKNSTLAREVELALPSLLSPEDRQRITEEFAAALVERYNVAVSVAIHEPGRRGDQRNHHAHILFTTREMTPDGLGRKTRILDGRKISGWVVGLNTALAIGNDVIKMFARLNRQCEIHCFVLGKNRAWFADIIHKGLGEGICRQDQGWEGVETFLRSTDQLPVVCSYSVCHSFPSPYAAEFLEGTETDDQKEEALERWYDLPKADQWALAFPKLHHSLEMKPEDWNEYRFSDVPNGFQLQRIVRETTSAEDIRRGTIGQRGTVFYSLSAI